MDERTPGAIRRGGRIGRFGDSASARLRARASREFLLVAACCRPRADPMRAAAVAAAAEGVDWPHVLRLVERHRLWGLARDALATSGVAAPAETQAALVARVHAMTRRNLAAAAETARLCELLRAEGVDALFLKGATLEAAVYGGPSLKHSRDIDVLVAPADAARARELLERRGYTLLHPLPKLAGHRLDLVLAHSCEWEFRRAAGGAVVELHWRLTPNAELGRGLGLSSPRQMAPVAGIDTPTLRREELFAYLCVHGAHHSWSRLKWLADLAALIATDGSDADLDRLCRAAETAGADRCAGQALLLCETLLGMRVPDSAAARVGGELASTLEAIALAALLDTGGPAATRTGARAMATALLPMFLLGRGPKFLACEVGRYLIAPADVAAIPLPSRFAWLYIVLRFPLWLARRLRARGAGTPKG
jgi:hypothetical protein